MKMKKWTCKGKDNTLRKMCDHFNQPENQKQSELQYSEAFSRGLAEAFHLNSHIKTELFEN